MAKFTIGLLVGILLMGLLYRFFPGGVGEAVPYFAEKIIGVFPFLR
jgi:hypothetical protein